ncbi:MAG: hypothetical protein LBQ23_03610 [Puniceicoccales bacterium]|nr:hypothetical protein [Puniceicoccales bacterium]
MCEQSDAESPDELTTVCNTIEESDEHFRKLREKAPREKEKQQNVSHGIFQKIRSGIQTILRKQSGIPELPFEKQDRFFNQYDLLYTITPVICTKKRCVIF